MCVCRNPRRTNTFTDCRAEPEIADASRSQRQVGGPRAIDVVAQREQGWLGLLFRNESSCDHETTGLGPPVGSMFEVSHLPVAVDGFIPQPRQQAPESLRHTGDDSVFSGPGFEGFEDRVKTETGIGPHANLADVGRNIGKASVQQLDAAVPGSCVTSDIHKALSGAPLISMMQSSHLGNSLDAPVFWLVHRPRHRRIFGQC